MEARAVARFQRVSPRKARLVVDLIRGKSVDEARTILTSLYALYCGADRDDGFALDEAEASFVGAEP